MRILIQINLGENGRARCIWTDEEIPRLLALWSDAAIHQELLGSYRKETVWKKLAEELKKQNFDRTSKQVSTKIKQLKKQYKDEVDKLRKNGVGLDSDDDDDIFVAFKWFFEIHHVMKRRAVVNPPALLQSSVLSTSGRSDTPATELGEGSETSLMTPSHSPQSLCFFSEEEGLTHDPSAKNSTTASTQLTIPTAPSASTTSSQMITTSTTTPSQVVTTTMTTPSQVVTTTVSGTTTPLVARARTSASTSTSSSSTTRSSSVGPSKKKRKLTKIEKADRTTTNMFEAMMKAHSEEEERHKELEEMRVKQVIRV